MAKVLEKSAPMKAKPKNWLMIGIFLLLIVAAGAAIPVIVSVVKNGGTTIKPPPGGKAGFAYVAFPEGLVVNLRVPDTDGARNLPFLKLKFCLRVEQSREKTITELIKKHDPVLRSWLIVHLSNKTVKDVGGSEGINRVCREILEEFNARLFPDGPEEILEVHITEFLIQ